jgi:hypothetical protein
MKQIKLTQGKVALVDDSDFEKIANYKWYASKYKKIWYAERTGRTPSGRRYTIRMHRQILGLQYRDGFQIDHRNRNGLDNQRINLRVCTQTENCYNKKHQESKSSTFQGVSWCNTRFQWRACITYKNKQKFLGYFDFEEDAAEVYNIAAEKCFGEFASLNRLEN